MSNLEPKIQFDKESRHGVGVDHTVMVWTFHDGDRSGGAFESELITFVCHPAFPENTILTENIPYLEPSTPLVLDL